MSHYRQPPKRKAAAMLSEPKGDDMGMGAGDETMDQGMPPEEEYGYDMDKGDQNTVMLSRDHFPMDMSPKKGQKLTFCVTGNPDSEGNVSGYFEGGSKDGEAKMDDWETEFKDSMSARAESDEPQ